MTESIVFDQTVSRGGGGGGLIFNIFDFTFTDLGIRQKSDKELDCVHKLSEGVWVCVCVWGGGATLYLPYWQ